MTAGRALDLELIRRFVVVASEMPNKRISRTGSAVWRASSKIRSSRGWLAVIRAGAKQRLMKW
jgi:hypothetical protein